MDTAGAAACRKCRRPLTAPRSRARGCGDRCWALVQAVEREGYSPAQIEKALELLADGGLVPLGEAGLWLAVPSSGEGDPYLVEEHSCTCPAGWKDLRCYHRAALLLAGHATTTMQDWDLAA